MQLRCSRGALWRQFSTSRYKLDTVVGVQAAIRDLKAREQIVEEDDKDWDEACGELNPYASRKSQEIIVEDAPTLYYTWEAHGKTRYWKIFKAPTRWNNFFDNPNEQEIEENDVDETLDITEEAEERSWGSYFLLALIPLFTFLYDWNRKSKKVKPIERGPTPKELHHLQSMISCDLPMFDELLSTWRQMTIDEFGTRLVQLKSPSSPPPSSTKAPGEYRLDSELHFWESACLLRDFDATLKQKIPAWIFLAAFSQLVGTSSEDKLRAAFRAKSNGADSMDFSDANLLISVMLRTGHFVPETLKYQISFFPPHFGNLDSMTLAKAAFNRYDLIQSDNIHEEQFVAFFLQSVWPLAFRLSYDS